MEEKFLSAPLTKLFPYFYRAINSEQNFALIFYWARRERGRKGGLKHRKRK